jgi:glutaminyl-peptide cyclotransferase
LNSVFRRLFILGLAVFGIMSSSACAQTVEKNTGAAASLSGIPQLSSPSVTRYTYQIVNVYPHNKDSFTEGLVWVNGNLYEGTGLEGKSTLSKVDLTTGKSLQTYKLPDWYFGEGITWYKDKLIQLTYTSNLGFIYNLNNFELLREFCYSTEGWGLTQDGENIIMSDGTSRLRYLNPENMELIRSVEVYDRGAPLDKINELEYINGTIYANIWPTDGIAIIEPKAGRVTGWIDLRGLLQTQKYEGEVDVLNGIAYDAKSDRLFVTGKWWPYLFEIKLVANE